MERAKFESSIKEKLLEARTQLLKIDEIGAAHFNEYENYEEVAVFLKEKLEILNGQYEELVKTQDIESWKEAQKVFQVSFNRFMSDLGKELESAERVTLKNK